MQSESEWDHSSLQIHLLCDFIRNNVQKDISLKQCSEMIGMSPSHVSRLFKKKKKQLFVDYVIRCKMEKTKRMLLEADYTLNEIARSVGYSERHLLRAFHRYMKLTPGQYRMANR